MNRYPLAPRQLSDGLVGLVRPRAPMGHEHVMGLTTPIQSAVSPYDAVVAARRALVQDEYGAAGEASAALLRLTGAAAERATLFRVGGKTPPTLTTPTDIMTPSPNKLKETHKRKRVDSDKSRRREQCRANQARYRDKQKNAQGQLEKSVEQLHKELDTLKRKFRDLSSRERSIHSPWSIVAEVFRLLETSFRFPWRMVDAREMKSHAETRQILAILERCFDHDATMGELRGVTALLEQLRLYSQCFGNPNLQLQRIESLAPGVMAARAKLSVTVTDFTLRHAFPHLEKPKGEDDGGDERELLYQRLVGQRLECKCLLNFLFDEDSDRVERLEASIDLATPLLRLLGNFKDVASVLEHVQITSECVIIGARE